MKFSGLVKKSIKSRTLIPDCFGYALTEIGFADKYLAGQVTMYKSYSWLKRRFQKSVVREKEENQRGESVSKEYVWVCWFQGLENAPQLVKDCYSSIQHWLPDKEIVLITEENYQQYVTFPEHIIRKWKKGIITNTHFSDILRLELLIKYGGLWLDATTYLTGRLPKYITETEFFVYRNGWMDMEMINMGSWLIYSKSSNNIVLQKTRDLLYHYWKKYDFMKNYFLMHMFFRMVTDVYEEEWKQVPVINHIDSHLLMYELEKEYDLVRCEQILELTSVHKLTYKFQKPLGDKSTVKALGELYKNRRK